MSTRRKTSKVSGPADGEILTVGQFASQSKKLLEGTFPDVWIRGEISRVTNHSSGHAYFTLKDDKAAISCAFFKGSRARSPAQPEDGLEMIVRGRATVYEPNGRFQVVVASMDLAGLGDLQRQFDELKKKLYTEGLFDEDHKQYLPPLPKRVGLITSPTGAAVQDIISTFRRRHPGIGLRVYPVRVQGATAVKEIVEAIALANERRDCDALILARGGGSLEDLHAFNDEAVARAVFASKVPLISGVGHEIDFSIADFVSDARAPTPTAAAEMLSPLRDDLIAELRGWSQHLITLMRRDLQDRGQHLDFTTRQLVHPRRRVDDMRVRLEALESRRTAAARTRLARLGQRLSIVERKLSEHAPSRQLATIRERNLAFGNRIRRAARERLLRHNEAVVSFTRRIEAISPLATLERGYAIVSDENGVAVRDASLHDKGDRLTARVAKGELDVTVDATRKGNS